MSTSTATQQPATHAVAAAALPLASLLHPNLSTSQLAALNSNGGSSTPQTPTCSTPTTTTAAASNPTQLVNLHQEERVYKKEKQILLEFDMKSKDLKSQLNEGIKCLEQRLDTQISILYEVQDFLKKRADVEMQYSKELDKMVKQIHARHKSEKSKRETWHLHSTYRLWESLLNDTKHHSKYHQVASEICSKYIADKFDDVIEDQKRIFNKCKSVSQASHEELFKVVNELNGAMKTYHEYQNESKQAEAKLKYVQSQKPKFDKTKSKKKIKQYEKQVEKRLQKYTETKVKAFKARNEYILSINSANACISKHCTEDISDLVDCMDFGFHTSIAKCIYMYLSAQENIKRSRQQTVDNLSRSIGDLDSNADKQSYLDYFSSVFKIQKKFQFEPYKGDEVSQVNAQSLIRYEMEKRFEQLDMRLQTLKTENDEIFKTIEATEQSLLNYFDIKNTDMSDLFRDLNLPNHNTALNKEKRVEIEDYYVDKVKQYTISSNLIARLEARHRMMQKALNGCVNSADKSLEMALNNAQKGKKKIGKAPIIGQPRLFGGKLIEYINVTKQEIPQIITSCVKAINRLGLHNQGIFRIPGSQLEVNQFKEAFEKGEDPLITVNPREMNSVAGVLKLYLRELKEPLFPRDSYDSFLNALRSPTNNGTANLPPSTPTALHQQLSVSNGLNATLSSPQTNQDLNASQHVNSASSDQILQLANTSSTSSSSSPFEPNTVEAIKVENIRRCMNSISKPIYIVMRYIFSFLNHLSEFKDENMMDAYNIAICLAPTLIPVPEDKKDQVNNQTDTIELIKLIIQHCDEIFTLDCGDAPAYEKFDTELMGGDEENLDESDEEDEEESEKQYLRNLSDDDTYVTEAVALYDYKGRSDKELSFKKGSILAIRGQLSTDWWHGSLVNSGSNTATPKLGYIPDKYIALRTCSTKKRSNGSVSSATTPQSASHKLSTPSSCVSIRDTNSLLFNGSKSEQISGLYQKSPLTALNVKSKLGSTNGVANSNNGTSSRSSMDIDLNRANLSEFMQGKESDILDDENGSDTASSSTQINRFGTATSNALSTSLCKLRSPQTNLSSSNNGLTNSASSAMRNTSLMIKKRTASSTSSHSIFEPNTNGSYQPATPHQHPQYTTYQTLSNPYKPTLKSTPTSINTNSSSQSGFLANNSFDDLLLSGNSSNRVKKMSQIENALASVLDDMKQLDFSTSLPDENASGSSGSKSNGKLTPPVSSPFSRNTLHTASVKSSVNSVNKSKPRPDIVMDLPLNLLVSTPPPVIINQNGSSKRASTVNTNGLTVNNVLVKAKEHLQSSSTTSTESDSSLTSTSSASVNSIGNGNKIKQQQAQTTPPIRLYNLEINENDSLDDKNNRDPVKSPSSVASTEKAFKVFTAQGGDENGDKSDSSPSKVEPLKKKPPPLMKKPEKSEEILRKLGRSPPQQMNIKSTESTSSVSQSPSGLVTTNLIIDINNKQDVTQSSLDSPMDRRDPQQSPIANPMTPSPSNCTSLSNKSNLSSRLSNSKATDV